MLAVDVDEEAGGTAAGFSLESGCAAVCCARLSPSASWLELAALADVF